MKTRIQHPVIHDTIKKRRRWFTAPGSGSDAAPASGNTLPGKPDDDANLSPFYWVLIGLVIVSLVAYAVVWVVLLTPIT